MSSVCRVCLSGSTTLHFLENNMLINVYEKLADTKFNSEDGRSRSLCYICYRKLLRCHTFSQMACRSEEIFSNVFQKGLKATQDYITEVNLEMKQQLPNSTKQFVDIDGNATNAEPQITIKDEPISYYDVEEAEAELNKLEELPEDKKNQLSLEEDRSGHRNDVKELLFNISDKQTKQDDTKIQFCCNNCDKQFFQKSKLISHIRNTHSKYEREKKSLLKKYTEKTSSNKDKKKQNRKDIFSCNLCDKRFYKSSRFDSHMRIHTGEKPFACNLCNTHFFEKINLDRHLRIHTGERPFACDVCNTRFRYKCNLVSHKEIHTGEKAFACNVCDKKFRRSRYLNEHIRIHTVEKTFACNVCDKKFKRKTSINNHMKIHTREKPFECNVCNAHFYQMGQLNRHMRIHTREKPFACDVCNAHFYQKGQLNRHMRIHTGEKPFVCDVCNAQFIHKFHLVTHLTLHTGEKPYACNVCHTKFTTKKYLLRHMRGMHPA